MSGRLSNLDARVRALAAQRGISYGAALGLTDAEASAEPTGDPTVAELFAPQNRGRLDAMHVELAKRLDCGYMDAATTLQDAAAEAQQQARHSTGDVDAVRLSDALQRIPGKPVQLSAFADALAMEPPQAISLAGANSGEEFNEAGEVPIDERLAGQRLSEDETRRDWLVMLRLGRAEDTPEGRAQFESIRMEHFKRGIDWVATEEARARQRVAHAEAQQGAHERSLQLHAPLEKRERERALEAQMALQREREELARLLRSQPSAVFGEAGARIRNLRHG